MSKQPGMLVRGHAPAACRQCAAQEPPDSHTMEPSSMSARPAAKAEPDRAGTSDVADRDARGPRREHLGHLSPRELVVQFSWTAGCLIGAFSCHALENPGVRSRREGVGYQAHPSSELAVIVESCASPLFDRRWLHVLSATRGATHHFTATLLGGLGRIAFLIEAPLAPMSVPSVPAFL